jgi:hypothetical protein
MNTETQLIGLSLYEVLWWATRWVVPFRKLFVDHPRVGRPAAWSSIGSRPLIFEESINATRGILALTSLVRDGKGAPSKKPEAAIKADSSIVECLSIHTGVVPGQRGFPVSKADFRHCDMIPPRNVIWQLPFTSQPETRRFIAHPL